MPCNQQRMFYTQSAVYVLHCPDLNYPHTNFTVLCHHTKIVNKFAVPPADTTNTTVTVKPKNRFH